MADVFEKVRSILVDMLGVKESEIKPETCIIEDLGADSLDIVRLIEALEDEYSKEGAVLSISDEDAENIETIQQVIDMLKSKGIGV